MKYTLKVSLVSEDGRTVLSDYCGFEVETDEKAQKSAEKYLAKYGHIVGLVYPPEKKGQQEEK